MGGAYYTYGGLGRGQVRKGFFFWCGKLRGKDHLENLLKCIFKEIEFGKEGVWTGLMWSRIGTCGGLL